MMQQHTIHIAGGVVRNPLVRLTEPVTLDFLAGEHIAIVGPNGAGKSTFVKTLLGIIKGTKGNLFINESDISTINLDKYYQYISYVSQDAPIFDGTILENITMNKEYAQEEIWRVLDMVLLKEKIEGLDKRLDTNIGEKGIKLSGGEKQKLAIARVLLQDASVIILDEATASMDYLSEEKVLQNLFSEKKDSLILLITHRLKAIEFVDKIFLLENGEIREEGSFAQLIKNRSNFYELWNKHAEQQMK
jgi:ATP-binding cassette subfamily B protein